jgi:hypothetical protein
MFFNLCSGEKEIFQSFSSVKDFLTLFCIFRRFERRNLLDSEIKKDLFCLHHIFLPVIQPFLDEFVGSWN